MKHAKFHPIETERLYLRKLQLEDVYEYYERLFGDGDVSRYMLFDPHQDIAESLDSLQRKLDRYEQEDYYCWGITRKEEGSLIGLVELLRFEEGDSSCSFVYMLGCDYWNKGYATEALKEVFRFAFEEMDVRAITADHFTDNPASGAVMRKAGMEYVKLLPGRYEKNGRRYDAAEYRITKETWEKQTRC